MNRNKYKWQSFDKIVALQRHTTLSHSHQPPNMAVFRILLLGLATLSARAFAVALPSRVDDVTLSLEPQITGGFQLTLDKDNERTVYGHIGRTLVSTYTAEEVEGGMEIHIGGVNLTVHTLYDDASDARGIKINQNDVNEHLMILSENLMH
ncbi:hypothetical protein RR48_04233 [Papilio machaon]|uniref:Uncharacterized protein n=1 Tax=Papilio machaon TaxID=76193 RepID=A0A0N1I807_PAPMA|nr:hypothetical protein RR48_04233 [Papilio machaon]